MNRKLLKIIGLAALLAVSFTVAGEEFVYALQTNPFIQPLLEPVVADESVVPEPATQRKLQLRGTMVGGAGSLANVDGVIVGIGEEVEGYKLVSVQAEQAVFSKDDKIITLKLDAETDDDEK